MKKTLLTLLVGTSMLQAQNATKQLDSIFDMNQAEAFLETKAFKGKIITFNEAKHQTSLAKQLFDKSIGGSLTDDQGFESIHYKVLEKNIVPYYRVNYIFFDGKQISYDKMNDLRQRILTSYENGIPFVKMAQVYSMDRNANQGGDTGWFTEGSLHPKLEEAIIYGGHAKNDIFIVDIPAEDKYYMVFMTQAPKELTEIKVLRVIEPKD